MRNILFKNAIILTITSFILRTLGIFLRSYMSEKISAEGMGIYQLVFSIYVLCATFATSGISTTVLRITNEAITKGEKNRVSGILKKSIYIVLIISAIVMIIFYFSSPIISEKILKDERTLLSIKILIFALPFMGISSVLKGYLLAIRRVSTSSISQLLEQMVRIALVYILLEKFNYLQIGEICGLVILSDVLSEMSSCVYLLFKCKSGNKKHYFKVNESFKMSNFCKICVPLALSRYVTSILRTIENILIPAKLTIYDGARDIALAKFGYLKGMALPLTFFPASFLTAMSSLLVTESAEATVLKNKNKIQRMVYRTFQITFSCSILIAILFFVFPSEIGGIFYKEKEVYEYIKYLAPLIPLMYMESAIEGILQGLNEQNRLLLFDILDSILRIGLIILIVPQYGMKGFIIVMYISNVFTSIANAKRVLKIAQMKFDYYNWLVKPLLASFAAISLTSFFIKDVVVINNFFTTSVKLSIIMASYIVLLSGLGILKLKRAKLKF